MNGYCVETYDYKTVAKKIEYVLKHKDSDTIKAMIERNRAFGLQHSWRSIAYALEKFYDTLIVKNK